MILFFKNEWKLFQKNRHSWLASFFFSGLILILVQMGLPAKFLREPQIILNTLSVSTLLACLLTLNRAFEPEKEGNLFPILRLEGKGFSFFASKLLMQFFQITALCFANLALGLLLFNFSMEWLGILSVVFLLAGLGISILGTVFSAMVFDFGKKDVLLPLILLPLLIPLLVAWSSAVEWSGTIPEFHPVWISLMILFDAIYLVGACLVFELLFESR